MTIVKIRQWHSLNLSSVHSNEEVHVHPRQSVKPRLLCTTLCGTAAARRCHHCVFLDINSANKCIRLSGWLGLRQAWNVGKVWIYQKIVHFRGTAAASPAAATRRALAPAPGAYYSPILESKAQQRLKSAKLDGSEAVSSREFQSTFQSGCFYGVSSWVFQDIRPVNLHPDI